MITKGSVKYSFAIGLLGIAFWLRDRLCRLLFAGDARQAAQGVSWTSRRIFFMNARAVFFSVVAFSLSAAFAQAQESADTSRSLVVSVRTIQAQGRIDDHEAGSHAVSMRIDGRLEDLADKLKRLPFRSFVYLDAFKRVVPVRKKEIVPLVNGQSLALRPLYVEDSKVGLWVHWQDRAGAEILDTRMHLDVGQSMIAGTDLLNDPSSGLVLAVEVSPDAAPGNSAEAAASAPSTSP